MNIVTGRHIDGRTKTNHGRRYSTKGYANTRKCKSLNGTWGKT